MPTTIENSEPSLDGMTLSNVPAEIYLEATRSEDDIGVLLRSHYLVETACESLCKILYYDYSQLRNESLSKHIRALRAFGFAAAALRMADVINKHRGGAAHVKTRIISADHVSELDSQSSGVMNMPGTILQFGELPTSDGRNVPIREAPLRMQYAVLSAICAIAIDNMAEKRKVE